MCSIRRSLSRIRWEGAHRIRWYEKPWFLWLKLYGAQNISAILALIRTTTSKYRCASSPTLIQTKVTKHTVYPSHCGSRSWPCIPSPPSSRHARARSRWCWRCIVHLHLAMRVQATLNHPGVLHAAKTCASLQQALAVFKRAYRPCSFARAFAFAFSRPASSRSSSLPLDPRFSLVFFFSRCASVCRRRIVSAMILWLVSLSLNLR